MSAMLASGAICFAVAGFGIPMHCPTLMMASDCDWRVRLFAGGSLLFWCVCLAYSVSYVLAS